MDIQIYYIYISLGLAGSNGEEIACSVGDLGLIPGSGKCSGEGNGKNSMNIAARPAMVHGVVTNSLTFTEVCI